MLKFAANLSFLYTELPFLDRFEAAAADGFTAVEFLFPYSFAPEDIAARLKGNGLQQVLFNLPPGGTDGPSVEAAWAAGERGAACLVKGRSQLDAQLALALRYAQALNCPRLHMMAGLLPQGLSEADVHDTYVAQLRHAARVAQAAGVAISIEPINRRDMPGYFLHTQAQAHALLDAINMPNVGVQMDLYHAQVTEGDICSKLRHYLPTGRVTHLQIAGCPDRHEPDSGELNLEVVLAEIHASGYSSHIGCEYRPKQGTSAGLGWLRRWR